MSDPNSTVHAGVAVLYGNSILLGKRIETHFGQKVDFGGYWSIFAGAMDQNEDTKVGAVRELFEETGIVASPKDLCFIKSIPQDNNFFYVYYYKVNELIIPKLNFEHTQSGWFDIFQLDSFTDKIDMKLMNLIKKHAY